MLSIFVECWSKILFYTYHFLFTGKYIPSAFPFGVLHQYQGNDQRIQAKSWASALVLKMYAHNLHDIYQMNLNTRQCESKSKETSSK